MNAGTRSLARSAAAYLACLSFPCVYLLTVFVGASWQTALLRGAVSAACVLVAGRLLLYPLVDSILASVAEAQRKREESDL